MQPPLDCAVHADEALLVLDKPAGVLSVPGRGPDKQDCLSRRIQTNYPDALVVHRLDMATSGLMLMARGLRAQRLLGEAFASHRIGKRYFAVVHGWPAAPLGIWQSIDQPIAVDWPNRPRRTVSDEGKPSLTLWRALRPEGPDSTWVELEPKTGRTHQLRVHMNAIGHPIVGDALYGREDFDPTEIQAKRLLLHSAEIAFEHPISGLPMRFKSPPRF
ncbi:MAG: RluA family pseudouridine synthase [Burkholderiaceae bacterium]